MADSNTQLRLLLEKAMEGDVQARGGLLEHACDRLFRLTRKMFHARSDLRRWEMTDDVYQTAMLRLHRALADVKIESVGHFFNLAAVMIRRTLLDMAKHHLGPNGPGTKHHTDHPATNEEGGVLQRMADPADEPMDLESWCAFHAQVEGLPDEERDVVGLIFYEGLTQDEVATVLGVSLRTVKRRWQSARLALRQLLSKNWGDEAN
jgi:RNA polymerase sigma-70 factor (ECF subfamily)